jgi:hypothetical protein
MKLCELLDDLKIKTLEKNVKSMTIYPVNVYVEKEWIVVYFSNPDRSNSLRRRVDRRFKSAVEFGAKIYHQYNSIYVKLPIRYFELSESIYNRSEMPQISGNELFDAISILQKNNIPVSVVELNPNQIKNSQKEIIKDKVKNIVADMRSGKKMPPCIISLDNWMVDGHHRNVAYKIVFSEETQKYIQIQLPRDHAIEIYKKVEDAL